MLNLNLKPNLRAQTSAEETFNADAPLRNGDFSYIQLEFLRILETQPVPIPEYSGKEARSGLGSEKSNP
jgi:hypothetical protein